MGRIFKSLLVVAVIFFLLLQLLYFLSGFQIKNDTRYGELNFNSFLPVYPILTTKITFYVQPENNLYKQIT